MTTIYTFSYDDGVAGLCSHATYPEWTTEQKIPHGARWAFSEHPNEERGWFLGCGSPLWRATEAQAVQWVATGKVDP